MGFRYLLIFTLFVFILFLILENKFPKRKFSKKEKIETYKTDFLILIFNNLILFVFSLTSLYYISANFSSFQLLSSLDFGNIYVIILTLVFLDLMIYFWHYLNHKIDFLWRFHKAHHSEIYLNSLSGIRFHIGELFLSVIFKSILLIIILGIPIELILISESLVTICSIFHHSNIEFKFEKKLSKIIIVPYIHQMHHSQIRKEHDSNYGVIFSFWDRIFRTLNENKVSKIGLKNVEYQNLKDFLIFGFK